MKNYFSFKCGYQRGLNCDFIPVLEAKTFSEAEDAVLEIMAILNPHGWADVITYKHGDDITVKKY